MLERQPRPLGFVGDDRADAFQTFEHVVHVDDRQILFANLLPLRAAGDAGDDAVAVPAFGDRRALLVVARVDQQMPMRVLLGVVRDAANDARAPARFRLDQHGDVLDLKLTVVIGLVDHADQKRTRKARRVRRTSGQIAGRMPRTAFSTLQRYSISYQAADSCAKKRHATRIFLGL